MASQAIEFYGRLYAIERGINDLPPAVKLERRQEQAVPVWDEFLAMSLPMKASDEASRCELHVLRRGAQARAPDSPSQL